MLSAARLKIWLTPSPARVRWLRVLGLIIAGVLIFFLFTLSIHRGLLPLIAWIIPALQPTFWDLAVYGAYPTQSYVSFDAKGPEGRVLRWDETCDDGLVLVAPFGPSTPHDAAMILDAKGNLVWMTERFGTVMNFRMQKWRGKNHLTFWSGQKSGSLGAGAYFILDERYEVVKKVHAVGRNLKGDLHEFEVTDDGTALITIYTPREADMRAMGLYRPEDGWIMDSMFQEVDIETGELRFEWRASDHFRPEETFYANPFAGRWKSNPFDFYHLNSIQKDSLGNFLISSRHFHTVSYVNGSDGTVEWTLGGNYTDFQDLSDGHATEFGWQHHAHWFSEEERILSVFDNQAAGLLHQDAPYSKGMLIQLDTENKTARLLQSYVSIGQTRAASQGSVQLLDTNDHVFVGWGSSAAYTEFDIAGNTLCEVHLAAESTFWWERVKSYRAYKVFDWVGKPENPPNAVLKGEKIYVSWNGGTGVKYWELQGSNGENVGEKEQESSDHEGESETPEWEAIQMIVKTGFEGSIALPKDQTYRRYRVAALDGDKMYMRYSDPAKAISAGLGILAFVCIVFLLVIGIAGVWLALRIWARRRQGRHGKPLLMDTLSGLELGRIGAVFGRRNREYDYSKL